MRVFKSLDGAHQRKLHIVRQAGGNPVGIELVYGQAFGFEKNLVRILIGEARDLVFDRRAIARADAFDHTGKQRRSIEPGANDVMRAQMGMRNPAWQLLRMLRARSHKRKHRRRIITRLFRHHRKIDAAAVDAWRRAGFKAAYREL